MSDSLHSLHPSWGVLIEDPGFLDGASRVLLATAMTRFRFWLAILLLWLSLLFNLERVHEPINLASFVYVVVGLLAAAIVVVPPMRKATMSALGAGSVLLMILLKVALGYEVGGTHLPLTVTEAAAILTTVVLAHQIARHTVRFEKSAAEVAAVRWQTRPKSFDDEQSEMYRELRRARRFDRKLSVVALEPTSEALKLSIDRLIEEVRGEMVQRYIEVRLADVLKNEVHDVDLVANYEGRFILLLPETDQKHVADVVQRIAIQVERELGLQLRIGAATFPDEEVTLTGLVERAEAEMAEPLAENAQVMNVNFG